MVLFASFCCFVVVTVVAVAVRSFGDFGRRKEERKEVGVILSFYQDKDGQKTLGTFGNERVWLEIAVGVRSNPRFDSTRFDS